MQPIARSSKQWHSWKVAIRCSSLENEVVRSYGVVNDCRFKAGATRVLQHFHKRHHFIAFIIKKIQIRLVEYSILAFPLSGVSSGCLFFLPQSKNEPPSEKYLANLDTGVHISRGACVGQACRQESRQASEQAIRPTNQASQSLQCPRVHMCAGHEVALLVVRCVRARLPSPPQQWQSDVADCSMLGRAVMPVCVWQGAALPYRPCLITGERTSQPR